MESIKKQLEETGFAVIDDFLTEGEIEKLKSAGKNFPEEALKEESKSLFATGDSASQASDRYFLDSGNKIGYFYETNAFSEDGSLKVNPEVALNKVGHALHRLHPTFRAITFSEKVKNVCRSLNLKKPAVIQSMYIYKNPYIGGEVIIHRDASYLRTDPPTLYGFWFALEDATTENGCLWFLPGSHQTAPDYRFFRNPDKDSEKLCISTGIRPLCNEEELVPTPVSRGSCVLIHGNVLHQSLANHSEKSRNVYTFHIYDSCTSKYATDNWLQGELEILYDN